MLLNGKMLKAFKQIFAQLGFILAWLKPCRCSVQPHKTAAGCRPGLREPSISPCTWGAKPAAPQLGAAIRHRRCPGWARMPGERWSSPPATVQRVHPGAAATAAEVKERFSPPQAWARPNLCLQGCAAQEVGAGGCRAAPGLLLAGVPRGRGPQVLLLLKRLSPVIPAGLLLAACGQEAFWSLSSC